MDNNKIEYHKTQKGRANNLVSAYRQTDKKYSYGVCDLTGEWIVENIFSKPCVHCGETDWRKLGCNRIDDTKAHTKDNVEPCCMKCNRKLPRPNERKKHQKYTVRKKRCRRLKYNFIYDIGIFPSISKAIEIICSQ